MMKKSLLILIILCMGLSLNSYAQGDLLVTPTRVVFERNQQRKELNLLNTGKDTAIYSISFVQKNMREDGSFENIDNLDTSKMFADPYLRIFPRNVKLAPGESQVVMMQCKRTNDMAAGEYRSHLFFRSEKSYSPLGMESNTNDSMKISVLLTPIFGLTIPVIIRSGKVSSDSYLSNMRLGIRNTDEQYLAFTINRTGNISLYGNIKVEFTPENGKPYQVAALNGVGVYTNIDKRNMEIKLDRDSSKEIRNGQLKILYLDIVRNKIVVLAEGVLSIK